MPFSRLKLSRLNFSRLEFRLKSRLKLRLVAFVGSLLAIVSYHSLVSVAWAQTLTQTQSGVPTPDQTVNCQILIAGGGLAGTAAAYEALSDGKTVCLTEITDWLGGQLTSQGTSALDETQRQRSLLFYPRGYLELRSRIEQKYDTLNPGDCWVSESCFLPQDAADILQSMLKEAERQGKGELKWFPATVIKDLRLSADGKQIQQVTAIQHSPAAGQPPLNTETLSQTIADAYRYEDSDRFQKTIISFVPSQNRTENQSRWFVIDATETGELVGLADVPYRLGIDPRSYRDPSSPSETGDPYCTQGFTYTFAMEQTEDAQPQEMPSFYPQYAPYYSYERENAADFNYVFTYRRIWDANPEGERGRYGVSVPKAGDISMQNWTWGNDYRPGTSADNLILSRDQLQQTGQLEPGGWMGGLRSDTLRKGEENAIGYYYWLVEGTTDSQLGEGVKQPAPNHRYLQGFDAPMGTAHGLSKYPYIRESRRILGRPSYGYENGFSIAEIDISQVDYNDPYYQQTLSPSQYRQLRIALAGLEATRAIAQDVPADQIPRRTRSTIYPDSVGIAQYAIDFHPCMTLSPPETPGNTEREGMRRAHGSAYPGQIPLRAMIPQKIDNLLVTGKNIATSFIAAAAYRVHSFEWSAGAAAGETASFALDKDLFPYELVDNLPLPEPQLSELQTRLRARQNPIAFPNTSIFNLDWDEWRVW
ncbi:FAD-dependent oxidoreductase [Leptolyngbya ohadii]|uniref:FAD-dependent oxidoreductase n=1 Tax=Leptolyngbya ohadii TaxID=1962290 RepID=UPI000B5992FB|nr:FAD-dependent oxidoreductase [Leptolyngbya ohadii]